MSGRRAATEPLVGDRPSPRAGMRVLAARGTIVNAAFLVFTNALNLTKALAVAALLTTRAYGTWGLLTAAFLTLIALTSVGVDDKYIQQDDPDQRRAFEVAFTLQTALGALLMTIVLGGMPLFALLYGRPSMIAPGLVFSLAIPAMVLQMPLWAHYRRMDFVRQRMLQLVDPVVSIVAVLSLAVAGLGVWALVVGELIGTWCAAGVIVRSSPYPLRLRWDRRAMRDYTSFSWPLFVGAITSIVVVQVPVTVTSRVVGLAAVGALSLANNVSLFATRVDTVVTQTLYPAICAVKDRPSLLFEAFWKSNRLALLWAAPVGCGAALFAGDFVRYVIGGKWHFAVVLLGAVGVAAAINQVGFNWTAFFRALGNTRPIAVASAVDVAAVMGIAIPLLAVDGLDGLGYGLIAATAVSVSVRLWFLRRIFPGLAIARHVLRGVGPTLVAAGAVLVVRALVPGTDSGRRAVAELVLFVDVAFLATFLSERMLLTESLGYLRRRRAVGVAV